MAVCIVLQLGNIIFIPNPLNEEEAIIANKDELKILSDMIGIPVHELSHCLTHKTMKAVHDSYQVPLKVADAKSTCDAFAKECYRVTFNWLVSKTNESTSADKNYKEANRVSRYRCISVLDICGFECFEVNGFEQLLINHANERLQKTFTETIIDAVMEEYNQEGITVEKIEHENNDTVIRFFEGKMGLMSLLNEECIRPQGSDAGFVNKIYASHSTSSKASKLVFHRHYQLSKTLFGVRHFAKDVTYDAVGFSMKNKDTLPLDVVSCAVKSTNDIIRNGIKPNESSSKRSTPRSKTALAGTSLWTSFERQMTNLFTQIKQTRVWFVRCIIPNNDKEPFSLDLKCALTQLRSVGLLTALKMSHASLPNKQRFEYILHRFWFMGGLGKKYAFGNVQGSEEEIRNDCEKMLTNMLTPVEDTQELFIMGRTKVYFREGSLEQLEAERSKAYDKGAMKIQARIRGILSRKKYKALKRQSAQRKQRKVDKRFSVYLIPFAVLPLYLARYLIGTVRRPSRRLCRGSWH
jgi:myosin-5